MKMSANDNDTLRLNVNRLSNLIELEEYEELNRMERPSRVFSSRHHLSMHPVLPDMEQNEHFRRSRDHYVDSPNNTVRIVGGAANGETSRNRSPLVRFTITDPETRQITAAGQIPLNSSPHNTHINATTTSSDIADVPMNEESDDEPLILDFRRPTEQRRSADNFSGLTHTSVSRYSRSGRRMRRFTELPYYIRNNLDTNNSSNSRVHNRRVRFNTTTLLNQHFNEIFHERSQTPEQELPEVLEQEIEPENQYEEVYHSHGSISSISSHNDVDSGDDRRPLNLLVSGNNNSSVDEENRDNLDVSNEIPRTRVVPFLMSPTRLSPRTDSPLDSSSTPGPNLMNNTSSQFDNIDYNRNEIIRDIDPRVIVETSSIRVDEHPETYEDLNDQLTRLFECPVCFEHIAPPIFQCLVGHLICNKCVIMCDNCPTCRNPFNAKRNLYMEKVGYLVKFPCKNSLTGCKQQMFIGQKEIHEQECCFRHYQCFFPNCTWKGFYPELHVHMTDNHNHCIINGVDQNIDIMLPSSQTFETHKWFLIAHCEYFAVIVHTTAPPRRVKAQVNFIGPASKAKQFKFTITLNQNKARGDMSQKLMYERSTLPYTDICELNNTINVKKDIFSMSQDAYEPYVKMKRRRLPLNIRIDRVSGS